MAQPKDNLCHISIDRTRLCPFVDKNGKCIDKRVTFLRSAKVFAMSSKNMKRMMDIERTYHDQDPFCTKDLAEQCNFPAQFMSMEPSREGQAAVLGYLLEMLSFIKCFSVEIGVGIDQTTLLHMGSLLKFLAASRQMTTMLDKEVPQWKQLKKSLPQVMSDPRKKLWALFEHPAGINKRAKVDPNEIPRWWIRCDVLRCLFLYLRAVAENVENQAVSMDFYHFPGMIVALACFTKGFMNYILVNDHMPKEVRTALTASLKTLDQCFPCHADTSEHRCRTTENINPRYKAAAESKGSKGSKGNKSTSTSSDSSSADDEKASAGSKRGTHEETTVA
jgi:hypothetical protein